MRRNIPSVYVGRKVAPPNFDSPLGRPWQRDELAALDHGVDRIHVHFARGGGLLGRQDVVGVLAAPLDDNRRWDGHAGHASRPCAIFDDLVQEVELRHGQLVDEFRPIVEGKERDGGGEGASVHG